MTFDTTTFVLEILNFLVLMWLLKRFFYKPVQAAIAARQQNVQKILDDAHSERTRAESLRAEYQQYLQGWETERDSKRQALEQSLTEERERQMTRIRAAAADEKARLDALCDKERDAMRSELQVQARQDSLVFLSRLMQRLTSPTLDAEWVRVLNEDLLQLSTDQKANLKQAAEDSGRQLLVQSAFPLPEDLLAQLVASVQKGLEIQLQVQTEIVPELVGGLRLGIGSQRLHLNLQDELAYFRDHIINGSF